MVEDFDSMALKTVIKTLLSKWGILSVEMQKAQVADGGVIKNEDVTNPDSVEYPDNSDAIEVEYTTEVESSGDKPEFLQGE